MLVVPTMTAPAWRRRCTTSAVRCAGGASASRREPPSVGKPAMSNRSDRKSTRLNSSHTVISYAVFCLKKQRVNDGEQIQRGDQTIPEDRPNLLLPRETLITNRTAYLESQRPDLLMST